MTRIERKEINWLIQARDNHIGHWLAFFLNLQVRAFVVLGLVMFVVHRSQVQL